MRASFIIALIVAGLPTASAVATPLVLYDVNFNSDALGQAVPFVPDANAPAIGRTHPTRASAVPDLFEPPTVVASVGTLQDVPALFSPMHADYSQLEFKMGTRIVDHDLDCLLAGGGIESCLTFDRLRDRYVVDVDILPNSLSNDFASTHGFSILLDAPSANRIDLTADGIIALNMPELINYRAIGTFELGNALSLHIEMDFVADRLSITKGDQLLASVPWTAFDLLAVRMGTSRFGTDRVNEVAVDNIRITAIPEPSTANFMGLGLAALGWRRRESLTQTRS